MSHTEDGFLSIARSLFHLPALQEAYLRRLLLRYQYSAAVAFMEVVLRGKGHLPPAS